MLLSLCLQQINLCNTPAPDDGIDDRRELDADDVDVFNNSQKMPVEGEDQARLLEFCNCWCEVFSVDNSWQDFSSNCVAFATEARELATELHRHSAARNPFDGQAPPPPHGHAL